MQDWYVEDMSPGERHCLALTETIYAGRTAWQEVRLARSAVHGKVLFLDGDIQSAQADEPIYHQVLVHPALIALPQPPRRVLILGGGEGATLREILRYPSIERVVMVDLDGELVEQCCKPHMAEWHCGSFDDPRLELRAEDARAYLDTCGERFDACIHDLPQPLEESPLRFLFSRECFARVRDVLEPHGVLSMQATTANPLYGRMHALLRRTAAAVFPHTASLKVFIPSFATEWGFVVAGMHTDVAAMQPEEVDRRLRERLEAPLDYYDGGLHAAYRAACGPLRRLIDEAGPILTDAEPFPSGVFPAEQAS